MSLYILCFSSNFVFCTRYGLYVLALLNILLYVYKIDVTNLPRVLTKNLTYDLEIKCAKNNIRFEQEPAYFPQDHILIMQK